MSDETVKRLEKTSWVDIPDNKLQKIIEILDMSDEDFRELYENFN